MSDYDKPQVWIPYPGMPAPPEGPYDEAIRQRLRRYVEGSPDDAVRALADGDLLTLVNFVAWKLDEALDDDTEDET